MGFQPNGTMLTESVRRLAVGLLAAIRHDDLTSAHPSLRTPVSCHHRESAWKAGDNILCWARCRRQCRPSPWTLVRLKLDPDTRERLGEASARLQSAFQTNYLPWRLDWKEGKGRASGMHHWQSKPVEKWRRFWNAQLTTALDGFVLTVICGKFHPTLTQGSSMLQLILMCRNQIQELASMSQT